MISFFHWREMNKALQTEVAPVGWSGSVTAMRIHHSGEIDNPWALTWFMAKKGDHSHYKKAKDDKSTGDKVPEKKKEKDHKKDKKKTLKSFKEYREERLQ
jgi:adenylyl- and sulfurtransferase ThiI